jgi:hypothetical protein
VSVSRTFTNVSARRRSTSSAPDATAEAKNPCCVSVTIGTIAIGAPSRRRLTMRASVSAWGSAGDVSTACRPRVPRISCSASAGLATVVIWSSFATSFSRAVVAASSAGAGPVR